MPKREYAVVTIQYATSKKEANKIAALDPQHSEVVELIPYNQSCPGSADHGSIDHAHALYDGATYCFNCKRYHTLRLEKRP